MNFYVDDPRIIFTFRFLFKAFGSELSGAHGRFIAISCFLLKESENRPVISLSSFNSY
jgi:hypothetical protein